MSLPECQTMIETCRAANVPLFVAYYRRALDRHLKIQEFVESGLIGEPRAVRVALFRPHVLPPLGRVDWRVDPALAGGGRFVHMGCPTLDFLDYVLGPIRVARGLAAIQAGLCRAEDIVAAAVEFESGVEGTAPWWFTSPSTAETAARTTWVMEQILASYSGTNR
jgi:predicted dehydrogenase